MPVPTNVCDLILAHHNDGETIRAISQQLHLPKSTVYDVIKRNKTRGSTLLRYRGRCGRPRRLSEREERCLKRASVVNPLSTARQLRASVGGNVVTASLSTVKRALRRQGRFSCRPRICPSLNAKQRVTRLRWCQQYVHWSVDDLKKVGFPNYKIWAIYLCIVYCVCFTGCFYR
jgi:transposase